MDGGTGSSSTCQCCCLLVMLLFCFKCFTLQQCHNTQVPAIRLVGIFRNCYFCLWSCCWAKHCATGWRWQQRAAAFGGLQAITVAACLHFQMLHQIWRQEAAFNEVPARVIAEFAIQPANKDGQHTLQWDVHVDTRKSNTAAAVLHSRASSGVLTLCTGSTAV